MMGASKEVTQAKDNRMMTNNDAQDTIIGRWLVVLLFIQKVVVKNQKEEGCEQITSSSMTDEIKGGNLKT